jgi:hypothetical protein
MIKKMFFVAATAATLFSLGCAEELSKLTEFDVPYTTVIPIPVLPYASGIIDSVSLPSPKFNTGIKKIFEQYGTSRDLIDKVTLNELSLTSKDSTGASGNFDFLKKATLYINAQGLPERKLAVKDSIPMGVSVLTFATSKVNMTDYIAQDSIQIRFVAVQRAANTKSLKVDCKMKFHVDAKILGK